MNIRKVKAKDKDFIVRANIEINELSGLPKKTRIDENFKKDLLGRRPKLKCIVAEENGVVVGFCTYSYIYWTNRGQGIYLSNAYVTKEYRNQGICHKMIDYMINHEKDVHFVTCLTEDDNEIMKHIMFSLGGEVIDLKTYCFMITKE